MNPAQHRSDRRTLVAREVPDRKTLNEVGGECAQGTTLPGVRPLREDAGAAPSGSRTD